jgi:hypothetical protein
MIQSHQSFACAVEFDPGAAGIDLSSLGNHELIERETLAKSNTVLPQREVQHNVSTFPSESENVTA